jgi:hypothetical protein
LITTDILEGGTSLCKGEDGKAPNVSLAKLGGVYRGSLEVVVNVREVVSW